MPDIGATLREARMARRLDITEVEAATKIRAKYLRALENEEWDLLPGPTFVRTFLRTYGDYLELDSRMLVEEYKQYFQRPSQQDLLPFGSGGGGGRSGRSAGRGRSPRGGRGIPPVVLVGLVVVVLLGVLFALGTLGGGNDDDPVADPTATPTASATPGQTAAQRRRARERRAARERAANRPERLKFSAVATGEVNVCVVNGTTEDVLINSETLSDGDRTRTIEAKRLLVVFGNNAVRMRIDGRTIQVPESGSPIGYDLRAGREPVRLAQADQPDCS